MDWSDIQAEAVRAVSAADSNCDAANSLRDVLSALVDANLQEDEESGSVEDYDRKKKAEAFLFTLATGWKAKVGG